MSITTDTSIQTNESYIQKHPLLSFFTLAIVITWLISLPSLLFEMPFKPFQTAGGESTLPTSRLYPEIQDSSSGLSDTYHVIAPDLPGHGTLAEMPFTFSAAAQTLADIIRQEAQGRALVVGLSLGGYIAMELARRSPELVAGLVLSGCSLNFGGILASYLKLASWLIRRGWLKLSKEQAEQRVKHMFPPELAEVAEEQLRAGVFPAALGPSYAEMAGRDFTAALGEYPGPSLILNGERDASSRRGELKFVSAARQGRAQITPDAGHACNLDQPEKYNLTVREFARSIGWVPTQAC